MDLLPVHSREGSGVGGGGVGKGIVYFPLLIQMLCAVDMDVLLTINNV